jgi:hypothetical protein
VKTPVNRAQTAITRNRMTTPPQYRGQKRVLIVMGDSNEKRGPPSDGLSRPLAYHGQRPVHPPGSQTPQWGPDPAKRPERENPT